MGAWVYQNVINAVGCNIEVKKEFTLEELHIYGRSRHVIHKPGLQMIAKSYHINRLDSATDSTQAHLSYKYFKRTLTFKQYELTNHLGNVLATVLDRKTFVGNDTLEYYQADVSTAGLDYAFGSAISEMQFKSDTGGGYRYTFNGKETDTETDLQDYGFRIYNPSIGKFLSVDPLADKYPWYTPYQFASNTPITAVDIDGLESSVLFNIPENPINLDPSIWTPIPNGQGANQGHSQRWVNKDGYILAYDKSQTVGKKTYFAHYHLYTSEGKRVGQDGKLAGYDDADGNRIYKKDQKLGPGDSHIYTNKKGGTTIKVQNYIEINPPIAKKISNSTNKGVRNLNKHPNKNSNSNNSGGKLNSVFLFLDIGSIFLQVYSEDPGSIWNGFGPQNKLNTIYRDWGTTDQYYEYTSELIDAKGNISKYYTTYESYQWDASLGKYTGVNATGNFVAKYEKNGVLISNSEIKIY
jgi:RHS repeat-associated protein